MAKKTPDDDSRKVFDKARVDLGINAVCDTLDELDLTMFERWWVAYHIEIAARSILGPKLDEWIARNAEKLGIEAPKAP